MIFEMNRMVIELEYRGIVPVENARGTRIDCLRGRIWITEQGCAADIVLEAGQSYDISRDGAAVVQALREALVAFRAPAVPQTGAWVAVRIERLLSPWAVREAAGHPAIAPLGSG